MLIKTSTLKIHAHLGERNCYVAMSRAMSIDLAKLLNKSINVKRNKLFHCIFIIIFTRCKLNSFIVDMMCCIITFVCIIDFNVC